MSAVKPANYLDETLIELRGLTDLLERRETGLTSWWAAVNLRRMKLLTLLEEGEEKEEEYWK